jgi:hypothetical protein
MATASARNASSGAGSAGPPGTRRRILRIGVLLGGKIIEERLVRERTDVTIGQSAKNTFSIPLESLPRQWTLFALENDNYQLRYTQQMDGRISDGGQIYPLDNLKNQTAQNRGDHWVLPLSDQSRGKVSIGELTLLFQFVTEPPKQPRPMLPASVRGTFADRIDPRLAVIMSISIILHFALALFAWFHDPRIGTGLADRAYNMTFTAQTYDESFQVPELPTTDTGEAAGEPKPAGGEKAPDKKPAGGGDKKPAGGGKPDGGRDSNDAVALGEQAANFADALFSDDDGGSGLSGDMNRRKPGTDLGQQLNDVRESGKTVAVGGGSGRGTRGDGDPRTGTGKGPKIDGPSGPVSAGGGKGEEKVPSGRISVSEKQTFDESTLNADAVLAKIMSAYMAGLKRCHKEALKTDPNARGKVVLKFTVNESGRVVSPSAKGFDSTLDACIRGRMESWRFAEPKDKDGDPTDATFQIALAMQPE